MRTFMIATLAAAVVTVIGMSASNAMPIAPLDEAGAQVSLIETTSGGCGVFNHRGPYGGCRPMFNCPPGWHSGPFGRHCFRNY
ncbi:MAG TPA: hypothetical protein VIY51_07635 [Xanthobacteraceae bacterium]